MQKIFVKMKHTCWLEKKKVNKPNYYFLSQKGNLKEAAKNLYSTLRKIKKKKYSSIAVCKIPDRGYGKTINDRLLRASRFNEKTTWSNRIIKNL